MDRLTYRDDTGRALLTLYGKQMYCSTQATADCFAKLEESLPRWVSVKERLPEPYFPVWAACKAEGRENWVIETAYVPFSDSPWGNFYILRSGKATVYAWAEKHPPEPPKEVDDGD